MKLGGLALLLVACTDASDDSGVDDTAEAWVVQGERISPDSGCREPSEFEVQAGDDCADVVLVQEAADGTCYLYPCWHDGQAVPTGASGPPDDSDWCSSAEWFQAQPSCPD